MSSEIISKYLKRLVTLEFIVAFILVTSLFLLWGAHSLLNVPNKHFLEILGITKARSGMAVSYVVPMVCFAFIAWYAFFRAKSVSGK
jgi:fucose permease